MVGLHKLPAKLQQFFLDHLSVFAPGQTELFERKEDGSHVGPGDRRMDNAFFDFLTRLLNVPVVSEERKHDWPSPHSTFWLVDPRDGSNNMASGLFFLAGSMVSLIKDSKPIFTAIFVPVEERELAGGFFFAIRGEGAWLWRADKKMRLGISDAKEIRNAKLLLEGPSRKVAGDDRVRNLQQIVPWRINLTCAIAFTRLALGWVDIVVSAHNKPTDSLHGVLLCEETGGVVTDFDGNPPTLANCSNLIFTNRALHPAVLKLLSPKENR